MYTFIQQVILFLIDTRKKNSRKSSIHIFFYYSFVNFVILHSINLAQGIFQRIE